MKHHDFQESIPRRANDRVCMLIYVRLNCTLHIYILIYNQSEILYRTLDLIFWKRLKYR